jgi:hypothetical protein
LHIRFAGPFCPLRKCRVDRIGENSVTRSLAGTCSRRMVKVSFRRSARLRAALGSIRSNSS